MEHITFPDGEVVELKFDGRSHLYKVDGEVIPSATKVLGVIAKPALVPWSLKMGAEWLASQIFCDTEGKKTKEILLKSSIPLTGLLKGMKGAHRSYSTHAMSVGTATHEWIEQHVIHLMTGGDKPEIPQNQEEVATACQAFKDWISENDVVFLGTEEKVFSRDYKYTGTYDAHAIVNGKITIIDWKTSKGVYPEYHLQNAAYAGAFEEIHSGGHVEQTLVLRLDKRYGTYEAEFQTREQWKKNHQAFLAALLLYNRLKELK